MHQRLGFNTPTPNNAPQPQPFLLSQSAREAIAEGKIVLEEKKVEEAKQADQKTALPAPAKR